VPACVLVLVWRELSVVDWHRAAIEISHARPWPIAWAALATLLCVSIMGLYDVLSMPRGSTLSGRERWRLGTAICSWTNFLAVGPLAGPGLRLYFYRRAGMDVPGVLRGLAGIYSGMFTGIAAWFGAVFVPLSEKADETPLRVAIAFVLGPVLCVGAGALISRVRRSLAAEDLKTYVALGLVGTTEWGLVVGVYFLVGRAVGNPSHFLPTARAFFVGHAAGAASLLPGGLGSADTVWLKLCLAQGTPSATAAAQVLLFRCVYFLWPWGLSIVALGSLLVRRSARRAK
jgi:uncharacterized membrane protein YbhN (UPF0104 family)